MRRMVDSMSMRHLPASASRRWPAGGATGTAPSWSTAGSFCRRVMPTVKLSMECWTFGHCPPVSRSREGHEYLVLKQDEGDIGGHARGHDAAHVLFRDVHRCQMLERDLPARCDGGGQPDARQLLELRAVRDERGNAIRGHALPDLGAKRDARLPQGDFRQEVVEFCADLAARALSRLGRHQAIQPSARPRVVLVLIPPATDVQLRLCVVSSLSAVALAAGDGDEALTDPLLTVPYEYDEVVEGWGRLHIHFDRRRLGEVDSRPALELHELFTAFFQEQFLSVGSCDGIQRSQP